MAEPIVTNDLEQSNGYANGVSAPNGANGALTYPTEYEVPGARQTEQPREGTTRQPSSGDQFGLDITQNKSQLRIVSSRFFHQRLAIVGLVIFAIFGIASVLVGHFWKYKFSAIPRSTRPDRASHTRLG